MKSDDSRDSKQLLTLERWRSAELETAQALYVKLARVAVEKTTIVKRVETDIAETQALARDLLSQDRPLSPQVLQGFVQFSALKAAELAVAQGALEQSRADSDAAHASVLEHFERLSVVERLRERRDFEATRDYARLAQKQLDEHALSRLGNQPRANIERQSEE